MNLVSGGWLLVYNIVVDKSAPSKLAIETSYRGVSNYSNNKMMLHVDAMNQLRGHLAYTQLRFHCSKPQGRTFHVTTAANSTGEAVVQFFSGQTNIFPNACGSFTRLEGDNSYLASDCNRWGKYKGGFQVNKWGHEGMRALNEYPAFIRGTHQSYHWTTNPVWTRWECDDNEYDPRTNHTGDWKIFVR